MFREWDTCRSAAFTALAWLAGSEFSASASTPDNEAPRIDAPIVFTQLPPRTDFEKQPGAGGRTLRRDYGQGGRIVRLEPNGQVRVLTGGFDSACGADVSFDGERILFAGRKNPYDPWNIWEVSADGSEVRQITRELGNCRSPAYQATLYTIVSTEPWYQIMFVSDAAGALNEYGCGPATSLYSCRLDGAGGRRLTMNLSDDLDPFLMADGRVLFAGWQRMDLRRGLAGRVSLFGVNTDGTDYALYCADQGQRIKHMPCETTGGLVVFVGADSVGWDGAGQLASVTVRRPFHSYRSITNDPAVLYHSPSPLPDGSVLVSRRPADGTATHSLYRLDPRTGRAALIFDDPNFHNVHARALVARPRPDGRSSVVNEEYVTGEFYCLNAYLTDPSVQPYMRPGMIRRLRVIEGVPLPASDPSPNGIPPIVQRRLLGDFPVERDGSFRVELPADLAVQLQALDENGMALRTCGWIWCKHREPRGCIGCHEDPELTPENRFVLALQKPAVNLTLPPDKRRTVDFRRDLMPIIKAKCSGCHQGADRPPALTDVGAGRFNSAYARLLVPVPPSKAPGSDPGATTGAGRYVHPGQARTSPLIWRLWGRNTSRPWDSTYQPAQTFPICPPTGAEPLTDGEKVTFVEWIDLGAHWDGIPGPDEYAAQTGSEGGNGDMQ